MRLISKVSCAVLGVAMVAAAMLTIQPLQFEVATAQGFYIQPQMELLAMAGMVATMPVKRDGKIIPIGGSLDGFDKETIKSLKKIGAVGEREVDEDFDLADTVQTLVSEGHDLASMNMRDIAKLLGSNAKGVKKADVDAALADIITETT